MTKSPTDKHRRVPDAKLDMLYRNAGDAEPDAGLDRIIRARAEETVRAGRSSNLRPWLGGLVTASVAIVAIAVVLQQSPPVDRGPASPSAPAAEESGAFMAPSVGADATLESSPENQRARREIRQLQSPAKPAAAEPAPPISALSDRAQSIDGRQREAGANRIVAEQSAIVAEKAYAASEEIVEDVDAMLARVEKMIEDGEIQGARELLEEVRQKYPDYPIPERIGKALDPLD